MNVKVGDTVFIASIMPMINEFDVIQAVVRTAEDTWGVAVERRGSKQAWYFNYASFGRRWFTERHDCLEYVTSQEEQHKSDKLVSGDDFGDLKDLIREENDGEE